MVTVGVLAFQGAVSEHMDMLRRCNAKGAEVRTKQQLKSVDALIIPGGESTTIGKLLKRFSLDKEIARRGKAGMPIYGTCAGLILLAKDILDSEQPRLSLLDISVRRNDYGRQVDSFETDLRVKLFSEPFPAVFIRAPIIKSAGAGVSVLAEDSGNPVFVRQGNILASTFHPELTNDPRIHKYFVEMIGG